MSKNETIHQKFLNIITPRERLQCMTISSRCISLFRPVFFVTFLAFSALSLLTIHPQAHAQTSSVSAPHLQAELISEHFSVNPGTRTSVALRLAPDAGWHVYWRYAGDSGAAPKLKWFAHGATFTNTNHWPFPERIPFGPLVNYGFTEPLLLIADLDVDGTAQSPLVISVKAEWLVCEEECIPGDAELVLRLPVNLDPPVNSKWEGEFAKTRALWPIPYEAILPQVLVDDSQLAIRWQMAPELSKDNTFTFFPDRPGQIKNSAPQLVTIDGQSVTLKVQRATNRSAVPSNVSGVLVASHGWNTRDVEQGITIDLPIGSPAASSITSEVSDSVTFWSALLLAIVGGMILNLMPCVFPVLMLKVLSLVESSTESRSTARSHALLYAAGVVASCMALAGVLLALQAGGAQLGWGFQLQSPRVVTSLALLMFVIGLNLAGVFEVGGTFQRLSGRVQTGGGAQGAFFSGVLTTLLATPCTAPFMGGAIAFALTAPAILALGVFAALGIGIAIPYVVISFVPALGRLLPRPGNWMNTFKQLMAFPMFATALWLVWVLGLQSGFGAVIGVLVSMLLLALTLWIFGQTVVPHAGRVRRWMGTLAVLIGLGISLGWAMRAAATNVGVENQSSSGVDQFGLQWESFSDARLAELLAQNRAIYLDFTAAWCITCQVNKQLVFSSSQVTESLRTKNVALLRADWTNRDAAIAQKLATYGRRGVPLNLLYAPGAGNPHIFPTILTASIVLEQLQGLP